MGSSLPKPLSEVPKGISIFIDANVFYLYLRGPTRPREDCTKLLERVEEGEVEGYTSTLVLDELAYKLLLRKIEEIYGQNPLEVIRRRREAISEASPYVERGMEVVLGIDGLRVLSVEPPHLNVLAEYMRRYWLLPRDALHVAVMDWVGCRDLASADEDFDRVPHIRRWAPSR